MKEISLENVKVVLFDLDGTLLPMEQDEFVKAYFGLLVKKLVPFGYEANSLIKAIWAGTAAMTANDGKDINENVFWKVFCGLCGNKCVNDKPIFEEYYRNEFQQVKSVCGFSSFASQIIGKIKEKGLRVCLATNPLFPAIATESRIRWAGLKPEDFEFYTTYENSHYCKPNIEYYKEIISRLDVSADECLMIGNDVNEDMIARDIGMQVFLLTDCIINKNLIDIEEYPHGNFEELLKFF